MKHIGKAVCLLCLITVLAGCGGDTLWTGVLYADFTGGATESEEWIRDYPFEYRGAQLGAAELAAELSSLTGLDFIVTAKEAEDGLTVDWAANSTLIAGLDEREQKEEFFFYDIVTLEWFMLDSLARTLKENLEAENIYYTMNGGKPLVLAELYPIRVFPADSPYMGSGFYMAHAEEGMENPYPALSGLWRLDGEADTASIEITPEGLFTMYYASGAVENRGYLVAVDEYEDGNLRYDMYSTDSEFIAGFYLDSATQLHIGNDDGAVYRLDVPSVG